MLTNTRIRVDHTPWSGFQGPLKFDAHLLSQQYPSLTLTPPLPAPHSLTLVTKIKLVDELSLHCGISGYLLDFSLSLERQNYLSCPFSPLAPVNHRVVQAVGCHTCLGCEQLCT